jgi:uncharacterized Zn finger protein
VTAVVHPRAPARRGAVRASRWWARAWVRAIEEAAYAEEDLGGARRLARSGRIGPITVDAGRFVAVVEEADEAWTVSGGCAPLGASERAMFVELVAAASGRVAALLGGDLPHPLVEEGEEAGVELLPYAGDLTWTCSCDPRADPCRHALAVGYQVGRLVDADPFVLLHLRGLAREELLAAVHARVADADADAGPADDPGSEDDPDLASALDAALRARRALALLEDGQPVEHLF